MIVRGVTSGWEVIFQSAHALLAGQIATQLRKLPKIQYWPETLAAIVDHDDHKESFGKNTYLTDLGAPRDFTQFRFTARERYLEVERRIEHGYRKHRWIGLLSGRHAEELYGTTRISKQLENLLGEELARRSTVLRDLNSTTEELEIAYAVLQWCDRTSLILCQGELPAMCRHLEIAPLAHKHPSQIWQDELNLVHVTPWPFQSESFTAHVEVRTVHQLKFRTDRELERCLTECAVEDRRWEIAHDE